MTPATPDSQLSAYLDRHGYAVAKRNLLESTCRQFLELIENARTQDSAENVSNSSGTYGLRNLFDVLPQLSDLLIEEAIADPVRRIMGADAFAVRATLFDKTAGANWGVFWHQDLSIAVKERHEVEEFQAWTRKAGVPCVQPPTELMEQVLAVRIHLDQCTSTNGALKVLPGTHRLSKLADSAVVEQQEQITEVTCELEQGGILLMRPLLLHASSPMEEKTHRRVIHLEFANFELPKPLEWRYRFPIAAAN